MAVLPADHFVWDEERFAAAVRIGLATAEAWPGRLLLLGAQAEGPEKGYGWIAPGAPLAPGSASEIHAVRRLWEKPDRQMAARLFAAGCLWNMLVLAGRLEAYLALAESYVPRVLEPLRAAAERLGMPEEAAALAAAYARIPPTNLTQALLCQCPSSLMVLAVRDVGWSDWGDPDRVVHTLHRYNRAPVWLPASARAGADTGRGMTGARGAALVGGAGSLR